ncbi:MAG: hypothetical protein HZC18_03005 [Candidatus Omnitrophica bacterium]|nr:hypothetical protein [Candidatus Omnitrophota bacterium]
MPLMNSATGFRAHRMLEVVVKGITLKSFIKNNLTLIPSHFRLIICDEGWGIPFLTLSS